MAAWKEVPWGEEREEFLRCASEPAIAWGHGSVDKGARSPIPGPGRELAHRGRSRRRAKPPARPGTRGVFDVTRPGHG
jgi:hypothetical protein